MIKMLELREIIRLVSQSSIEEFNLKNRGIRISMKKSLPVIIETPVQADSQDRVQAGISEAAVALEAPSESVPAAPTLNEEKEEVTLQPVVSPFVGIFTSSGSPGAAPLVKVGDKIASGSVVCRCIVEALGIVHEIKSNVGGEIVQVLVQEGQLVEYGEPLFLVKPE